jgi:hypothetical protein
VSSSQGIVQTSFVKSITVKKLLKSIHHSEEEKEMRDESGFDPLSVKKIVFLTSLMR